VHPIAGNVTVFLDLARRLGRDQAFYALQAPGIEKGQTALDRVEDLAALYVDAVENAFPTGPYRIGGYSFGGVVAFEMARRLSAKGHQVALLAIIDTPAPVGVQSILDGNDDDDAQDAVWLWRMVRVRERFHGVTLGVAPEQLAALDPAARRRLVLDRMRDSGVLPDDADGDLLDRMVAVSRSQYQAYLDYRPGLYDGPITLLRAAEVGTEEAAADTALAFADPAMNWGGLTPFPVTVVSVPGDHVTVMTGENVQTLASTLRGLLSSDGMPVRRQSGGAIS
jgi:thioesterase domain-containing protein